MVAADVGPCSTFARKIRFVRSAACTFAPASFGRPGSYPYRRKVLYEPLEPRLLLSADLAPQAGDALVSGLQELRDWAVDLSEVQALEQTLPLANLSVNGLLSAPDIVQQQLINPVAGYFAGLALGEDGNTDDLAAAINAVAETTVPVTGDEINNKVIFDVAFNVNRPSNGALGLGPEAGDLGLELPDNTDLPVTGNFDFSFSFGLDTTDGSFDAGDFFIAGDFLSLGFEADADPLAFPLTFGLLDTEVENGQLALDARVVIGLGELDTDGNNEISVAELQAKSPGAITDVAASGSASGELPIELGALAFAANGDPAVVVDAPDLFSGAAPGITLNGDFAEIANFEASLGEALANGLSGLARELDEAANTGLAGQFLFPLGTSVNEVLALGDILEAHLAEVVRDFVANGGSVDELVAALNAHSGIYGDLTIAIVAAGDLLDDVLALDLAVSAGRVTPDFDFELGDDVEAFLTTDKLIRDLTTHLDWNFTVGVNLLDLASPAVAFFGRFGNPLNVAADVSIPDLAIAAQAGFLGLEIGTVNGQQSAYAMDVDIALNVAVAGSAGDGSVSLSELSDTAAAERVSQSGTAQVTMEFVGLSGIDGVFNDPLAPPSLSFSDDLFEDEVDPVVTENFTILGITAFSNTSSSQVRTGLNTLGEFLDGFVRSEALKIPVPLASGLVQGEMLAQGFDDFTGQDLNTIFRQAVMEPLQLPQGEDDITPPLSFATVQGLQTVLGAVFSNIAFDAAAERLDFDLTVAGSVDPIDGTIALFDMGALTGLVSDSAVTSTAEFVLTFGFGLLMTPFGSNVGALNEDTEVSRLNGGSGIRTVPGATDIEVKLRDGTRFEVDLDHDAGTALVGEIAAAIQAAADAAAGVDQFQIGFNENEDGFELIDRTAGSQDFTVTGVNGSLAVFSLGLGGITGQAISEDSGSFRIIGSPLHDDTVAAHFIVRNATLAGDITTSAGDIDATGKWGALEVDLVDGDATAQASFSINFAEPDSETADGVTTLRELFRGTADPLSVIADRADLASVDLTLPLRPTTPFAGTNGFEPVYAVTSPDIYDGSGFSLTLGSAPGNLDTLLTAVAELGVEDLLGSLDAIGDYLADVGASQALLADPFPGLGQSPAELLDVAGQFRAAVAALRAAAPDSLQGFADALATLPGLSGLTLVLDSTAGSEALRFGFDFALDDLAESIALTLDLTTLGVDLAPLGLEPVGVLMDSAGASPIPVTGGGALRLDFDIALDDPAAPALMLRDSTAIDLTLSATSTTLGFDVLLGALAARVSGGSFVLDADGDPLTADDPLTYRVSLLPGADGRHLLASAGAATEVALTSGGALSVDLPFIFPAEIPGGQPHLVLTSADLTDVEGAAGPSGVNALSAVTGSASLSGPDITDLLSGFDLLGNLDSFRQGWDELWMGIDHVLETKVYNQALPLLGTQLGDRIDIVDQLRTKVADNLGLIAEALTPELIRQALFDALGPGGLGWLRSSGGGAPTLADIVLASTADDITWAFELAAPLADIPGGVDIDLALPGLGLEIDGQAAARVGFNFPIKVGIGRADGVFVDAASLDELTIDFEADLAALQDADGTLGFLPVTVNNNDAVGGDSRLEGGSSGLTSRAATDGSAATS